MWLSRSSPRRRAFLQFEPPPERESLAVIEMEITSDVAISFAHSQYDTNALPVGFVAALYHPLNWYVTPELTCTTSELIHRSDLPPR